jgi:hypothetical protein
MAMESSGGPGMIQIASSTWRHCGDRSDQGVSTLGLIGIAQPGDV